MRPRSRPPASSSLTATYPACGCARSAVGPRAEEGGGHGAAYEKMQAAIGNPGRPVRMKKNPVQGESA